jgi:hypothetical protein
LKAFLLLVGVHRSKPATHIPASQRLFHSTLSPCWAQYTHLHFLRGHVGEGVTGLSLQSRAVHHWQRVLLRSR